MLKTTFSKECQNEMIKELEIIYPWSCKNKNINTLNYDGLFNDIETYWNEEARFREDFKLDETSITIPNFFSKINGIFSKKKKYNDFIKKIKNSKNTFYFDSLNEFNKSINRNDITKSENFLKEENANYLYDCTEIYKLMLDKKCHLCSYDENFKDLDILNLYGFLNKIDNKNIRQFYFLNLSPHIRKQLLDKLDEFYKMYKDIFSLEEMKEFEHQLGVMYPLYGNILNNWDYPFEIPKIIIKENESEFFERIQIMYLLFFNLIGFDIIILNPYGKNDLNSYIDINEIQLDVFQSKKKKHLKTKKHLKIKKHLKTKKHLKIKNKPIKHIIKNCIINILFMISILIFIGIAIGTFIMSINYAKFPTIPYRYCLIGLLIVLVIYILIKIFSESVFIQSLLFIIILLLNFFNLVTYVGYTDNYFDCKEGLIQKTNIESFDKYDFIGNYDEILYSKENTNFSTFYFSSSAKNEKNCMIELKYGNISLFDTSGNYEMEPFEYIENIKLDKTLPIGEYKLKLIITIPSKQLTKPDKIVKKDVTLKVLNEKDYNKLNIKQQKNPTF